MADLRMRGLRKSITAFCGVCGEIADCWNFDLDLKKYVCPQCRIVLKQAAVQLLAWLPAQEADIRMLGRSALRPDGQFYNSPVPRVVEDEDLDDDEDWEVPW